MSGLLGRALGDHEQAHSVLAALASDAVGRLSRRRSSICTEVAAGLFQRDKHRPRPSDPHPVGWRPDGRFENQVEDDTHSQLRCTGGDAAEVENRYGLLAAQPGRHDLDERVRSGWRCRRLLEEAQTRVEQPQAQQLRGSAMTAVHGPFERRRAARPVRGETSGYEFAGDTGVFDADRVGLLCLHQSRVVLVVEFVPYRPDIERDRGISSNGGGVELQPVSVGHERPAGLCH